MMRSAGIEAVRSDIARACRDAGREPDSVTLVAVAKTFGPDAVEPVIGHAKAEHRMGRNYLAGTQGDAANAVLAAAGYNFRRLLEWLGVSFQEVVHSL